MKKASINPENAEIRHGDVILTVQCRHGSMCCSFFLSFLRAGTVCHIDLSHMGKNNGNHNLVCEKMISYGGQIVEKRSFHDQFKKIVNHYKRVGYSVGILRQSACLVINPITVYI